MLQAHPCFPAQIGTYRGDHHGRASSPTHCGTRQLPEPLVQPARNKSLTPSRVRADILQLACNLATAEANAHSASTDRKEVRGMPVLQLPEPSTEKLEHSPLELVVCQVRHERNLAVADAKRRLRYTEGWEASTRCSTRPPASPSTSWAARRAYRTTFDQQRGWNFRPADGAWTVVLMPEFFALETRAYTDWADSSSRLDELVRLVESVLEPSVEQRLGLRFIDRVKDPVAAPRRLEGLDRRSPVGACSSQRLRSGDQGGPAGAPARRRRRYGGAPPSRLLAGRFPRRSRLALSPRPRLLKVRGRAFSPDDIRDVPSACTR